MTDCQHCGLPTPSADDAFCCGGCAVAFALIQSHGLHDYYRLRTSDDAPAAGQVQGRLNYEEFDRDELIERYSTAKGPMRTIRLGLSGIHCAACIWLLERLPRVLPGVLEARVQWQTSTIAITWSPASVGLGAIARTLEDLGYRPHLLDIERSEAARTDDDRRRLINLAMAGAAAGNAMIVAIALYLGERHGMTHDVQALLRWVSALLGGFALLIPGRVFFIGAWAAVRARTPHMDLPVALGLFVGGVAGMVNVARGTGEIYFDTLTVLVFLLLVGRFIQHRQQHRAAAAVEVMHRLTPRIAHKSTEGIVRDVPVEVLVAGDLVDVLPGETVPADGVVAFGESTLDQAVLTGETLPTAVGKSDAVAAGTINLTAPLRVEVHAVGENTRMGRVLSEVQTASSRPAIVALADRVGAVFVVAVVVLASLTFGVWSVLEPAAAVDRAVALLIVACPCALALATPLALAVALGRASQRKILIKGGDVLQRLAQPGVLWLDKTGTITEGRMKITRWVGEASAKPLAAALERHSTHPIASAFRELDHESLDAHSIVRETRGIEGRVGDVAVMVGSAAFLRERGVTMNDGLMAEHDALLDDGISPVAVALDGSLVALAGVSDPIRRGAPEAIAELKRRGWTLGILSGDHPAVVDRVARAVGIEPTRAFGGLLPEQKVSFVAPGDGNETAVMVGDGLNDSAALGAAAVGIATQNGAEASLLAASVYAGQPGLRPIVELVEGANTTLRTIHRNFAVSLAYNIVAVGLAATGFISPWVAAVLMPLSSISVVGSSLALRWKGSPV